MGPARTPPKRPRLLTSLGAWVVVASLLCLHRATRDVTKCMPEADGLPHGAGGGAAATAATSAAAARSLSHDEIESLIRQPATLHGVVQKGGLPANYSFMVAHLTDTNPDVREEGIPATMGPALMRWFAHAYT